MLKLGPCALLGLLVGRGRVRAGGRERPCVRRSKPYMEGYERGFLTIEEVRRLEVRFEETGRC